MKDTYDDPVDVSLSRPRETLTLFSEKRGWQLAFVLIAFASFGLYWLSAVILEARDATTHFGADTWSYAALTGGDVWARVAGNESLSRLARFHPTTIALIATWMALVKPLTALLSPAVLLKALFAAIGAVGVFAATLAFSRVMSKSYAALFGMIYAASLGIWYFSSIEESKIITATLATIYIAGYLRLRENWSPSGAIGLTVILAIACLNEIVSGFLVIIPAVDALVRRGWDPRNQIWIVLHALAAPMSLLVLETVFRVWFAASATDHEGASHVGMLLYYVTRNAHGWPELYAFLNNWLFFNISAPTPRADYGVPLGEFYSGYFEPSLLNYVLLPATVVPAIALAIIIAVCARTLFRGDWLGTGNRDSDKGILLGLVAYTVVRGAFFFVFNPPEPLLFSPAVTLAHLLIIAIPFMASTFPAKRLVLIALLLGLLIANGSFILIPDPDEIGMRDDQQL